MEITASLIKELREKSGAGMLDVKKALEENNGDINASMDWLREKGIAKASKKADRIAAEGLADILVKDNKAVMVEVNSETDFVSKNDEFKGLVKTILEAIIDGDPKSEEDVLALATNEGTVEELITAKTAKIGEKLSFRRFEVMTKNDDEVFGSYIHLGGKIAVLSKLSGANAETAKDVSMQAAAMYPKYIRISDVPETEVEKERNFLTDETVKEGKPEDKREKIVEGKMKKFFSDICLEEQAFVKDSGMTVKKYVESNNGEIIDVIRFEVGEGLEKREDCFADEVAKQLSDLNK